MICILKMRNARPGEPIIEIGDPAPEIAPEIDGWIIASDTHDARHQAEMAGDHALAQALYRVEFPAPGRHELSLGWVGEARYVMLVS